MRRRNNILVAAFGVGVVLALLSAPFIRAQQSSTQFSSGLNVVHAKVSSSAPGWDEKIIRILPNTENMVLITPLRHIDAEYIHEVKIDDSYSKNNNYHNDYGPYTIGDVEVMEDGTGWKVPIDTTDPQLPPYHEDVYHETCHVIRFRVSYKKPGNLTAKNPDNWEAPEMANTDYTFYFSARE